MSITVGTIDLTPGRQEILLELVGASSSALGFQYSGPDTGGFRDVPECAVAATEPTSEVTQMGVGGLTAELFFTGDNIFALQQMPDLSAWRRDTITSDAMVDYDSQREPWTLGLVRSTFFAARWSGGLYIHDSGTYTFHLESDDGSLLYIDAGLVVDHDGRHGNIPTKSSTVVLIAGWHSLVLDYFQHESKAIMIMSYSGPDTGEELMVIPPCALTPSVVPAHSLQPGSECMAEERKCACVWSMCTVQCEPLPHSA
eukprot:3607904-Amphidinium_carterae.1